MNAVSAEILESICELQNLNSLNNFLLGGGTNIALRYNHRKSIDIDLFCPDIIGKKGFYAIEQELSQFYGERITGLSYPCNIDDQFCFMRFFLQKNDEMIKVELLQNFKNLETSEQLDNIRLLSINDIGLYKLSSAANRASKKDIYDLDFITNTTNLIKLYKLLKSKIEKFNLPEHRTIFDLDNEVSPIDKPELLLSFDDSRSNNRSRPFHLQDRIDIIPNSKSWQAARISWRSKVRQLFNHLDIKFPGAEIK
ncbi:nucleotidyl transferase AbiEii/AbiGii toxin family protein [Aquimarina gracilis]|uniref:Nucleotidyl transferase AbiEii/AbiGii toxin family protein n=1 Tax=Aquimarina gracilis TaxID=874422 RepID=A0ABU5ZUU9_9FLAO|nr:nucleotidyl transferase AbiEii/AbiGii toxin family protein [Aquimarina gracilis]MEB3345860.1 nucleotidyl transferase AbiEii/AbiGii toxin family protein [Aquimarina gracilis]